VESEPEADWKLHKKRTDRTYDQKESVRFYSFVLKQGERSRCWRGLKEDVLGTERRDTGADEIMRKRGGGEPRGEHFA